MKLFQYWDTGDPPDDVAASIESLRAMNPKMDHRLFDRDDAAWFIRKRFGDRQGRAFEACAVPAMQADYFRLAALTARGGVWADVDWQCVAPLDGLLVEAPRSLMLVLGNRLVTELIVAQRAGDAFMRACLELATRNVEDRLDLGVIELTGPGVPNAIWAAAGGPKIDVDPNLAIRWSPDAIASRARAVVDASVGEAMLAMTRRHVLWPGRWLRGTALAYKEGARHWTNWRGSPYLDPQVPAG